MQPILQVEDDHEEFHSIWSKKNILLPQEGPLCHSERTPIPRHHFDIETSFSASRAKDEMVQCPEKDEPKTIKETLSSQLVISRIR